MNIVVAGAGYTGARVLWALKAGGDSLINIGRRRRPRLGDIQFVQRDFDAPPLVDIELPSPYSLLYTVPPAPSATKDSRIAALFGALSAHPRRIVYISTSGVYGDQHGALTDENVLPAPANGRSRKRWEAEKILLNYCTNVNCDAVILRVPGIYGPQRLGLKRIEAGTPLLLEADANPGNRIHVDDLVQCCIAALQQDTPAGVYNVGDGDFRSSTWFASKVAELCGHPPPPQISRDEALQMFPEKRLSFLAEARRLDTGRMSEVLGVTPRYTNPEDGIRASLLVQEQLKGQ